MNTSVMAAEPAYFGPPGARLFGWLHRAAERERERGLALLVCNPFGFEEVCAHRSLRDMACAAAASGVPALRFDYAGCGNSEGEADEGDQVARWQTSVHQAIEALKEATGARRVCLMGVRLGALLAARAALERDDVAGLVAIAPVYRGSAYLRELKLLGRTGRGASADGSAAGLESAGFVLSAATCQALSAIDLSTLPRSPAHRVLIVERDDVPDKGEWSAALARLGADVEAGRWPGYAAMVDDPQRARTPPRIVEGLLAWLTREQELDGAPINATDRGAWRAQTALDSTASEEVLHVDVDGSRLFGFMHRPSQAAPGPAILMLSAGSVHAIGPNRLWVRLARRWAASGLRVLRLDIAGIGDSDARPGELDNVVYSPHAMADVATALQWLREREGATTCHAMGLCSGAYHAFKAATTGLPVASAVMINPLTYFWEPGTPLSDIKDYEVVELSDRYRSRLFTLRTWRRLVRGDLHLSLIATVIWRNALRTLLRMARGLARLLRLPLKNDLARELRRAARLRVPLRFVFGVDATGYVLLREQSGRVLDQLVEQGAASIDFVPDSDHTFTRHQARERLVGLVDSMIRKACLAG